MNRRSVLFVGLLILMATVVRYGNAVLILFESDAPSESIGSRAEGRLKNGKRLPSRGRNFSTYSDLGALLGRTSVHGRVRSTLLDAFAALENELPAIRFQLGETGWPRGGRFRPHKTHQHGLSVDFMVPMRDERSRSVHLPCRPWNKFGYSLELDGEGRLGDLRIDFDAVAAHLLALVEAGREHGVELELVILDPKLQPLLLATSKGPELRRRIPLSTRRAWVRHDEHYHVDFRLDGPMTRGVGLPRGVPPGGSAQKVADRLRQEQQPGGGVEHQVEPVQGPHESALDEHLQLLPQMRRGERGEPQGEAKDEDYGPGELVKPDHGSPFLEAPSTRRLLSVPR